jgi:hypothetical protein
MKNTLIKNYKKIIFGLFSITLLSGTAFAAEPAFDKGSNVIGLGIGMGVDYGNYSGFYGSSTVSPTIYASYDHGFFSEVGPGTIGIGAVIAYKSSSSKYLTYKSKYSSTIVGLRGTYHLTLLKDKNNKFDPYAGVTFGLRFNNYTDPYADYYNLSYSYNRTNAVAGVFVGAHYNFVPNFGAHAELGYDISFFRVGVNFNF